MTKLKRLFFIQNISSLLSIISIIMSLLALFSVSSLKDKVNNRSFEQKNKIRLINEVPDVEVIKIDGSVAKVNATKSHDMIGKLLNKENEQQQNKNEDTNKNEIKEEKQNEVKNDVNDDSKNLENIKDNKVIVNSDLVGDSANDKEKVIVPIQRTNKDSEKKKNQVSLNKDKNAKKVSKKIFKKEIFGKFVVQASAFKDKSQAEKQCKKINAFIKNKRCSLSTSAKGHFYRTIVYPFMNHQDALNVANKLSAMLKVDCFVKKNA